jgi:hypothetical protein
MLRGPPESPAARRPQPPTQPGWEQGRAGPQGGAGPGPGSETETWSRQEEAASRQNARAARGTRRQGASHRDPGTLAAEPCCPPGLVPGDPAPWAPRPQPWVGGRSSPWKPSTRDTCIPPPRTLPGGTPHLEPRAPVRRLLAWHLQCSAPTLRGPRAFYPRSRGPRPRPSAVLAGRWAREGVAGIPTPTPWRLRWIWRPLRSPSLSPGRVYCPAPRAQRGPDSGWT